VKIENRKDRLYKKKKDKNLLFGYETDKEIKKRNHKYKKNILIEETYDESNTQPNSESG